MKQVKIDLAGPFEEIVGKLCSIPSTHNSIGRKATVASELSADVAEVVRGLYAAARGRQVGTQIGLVPIAPPLASYLKDAPFYVETQTDFLLQALTRLCTGSCPRTNIRPPAIAREVAAPKAEFQANRSSRRPVAEPFAASR